MVQFTNQRELMLAHATRIRGYKGQKLRKARLQREPLCRHCLEKGIVRASTVPDHILALTNGGTDTDDNIQCLCADCHDRKTREDLGQKPKVTIGLDGFPIED